MIFERLNRSFSGVDSMVGWFDELPSAIGFLEIIFDGCCCLIIGHIECWLMSFLGELGEDVVKSLHNSCILNIFDGVCENLIDIIIIGDTKILISIEGHNREGAGRIRV